VEQALQHLTDATVSDSLLRHLLDPIMNERLTLAYAKLDELMAVHKEHPETRNHYFVDKYNALQRNQWATKTTKSLEEAFKKRGEMDESDITYLVTLLRQNTEADADLAAAESTFNAMEAFYKVYQTLICSTYILNRIEFRSLQSCSLTMCQTWLFGR
jgi:hypothetical protein